MKIFLKKVQPHDAILSYIKTHTEKPDARKTKKKKTSKNLQLNTLENNELFNGNIESREMFKRINDDGFVRGYRGIGTVGLSTR